MSFTGVTVMPEYIQNEGIDGVLNRLVAAGVTAVTTSPYVMAPADEKTGSREPPIDAGAGAVRLLDRPLWGKRELFVNTAPSFVPQPALYKGLRYQPPPATELTRKQGRIVHDFIRAAQGRHIKVYFQVQAAIPPGYRVQFGGPQRDDAPRLPDGRIPPRRLANNGSLASPNILAYLNAMTRDLLRAYPDIDGMRYDWPEYPPYFLDDVFLDFSDHARAAAGRLGFNFESMRKNAAALYTTMHGGLTDDMLKHGPEVLREHPWIADWLRFKATLVEELLTGLRRTLGKKTFLANAFPPPFSIASGMDFKRAARHVDGICMKLYTMHWPVILRFYGDVLKKANPKASEAAIVQALQRWLEITDDTKSTKLADWVYPEPDAPHPAGEKAQAKKVVYAQREAGATPVYAVAHGYGPLEDFRRRLNIARRASTHGVWINRYAYLSDAKLASF
jgi:hypothetical protein